MHRIKGRLVAAVAMVALIFGSGLGTGLGLAPLVTGIQEGPRLVGRLLAEAFHPLVSAGCDTELDRMIARAGYLEEQRPALVRLLLPARAHAGGRCVKFAERYVRNLIVNAGENYLVDAWQGTVEPENLRYHGIGTGNTAAAETDTGCQTEVTTNLNPDNTRATGSLTEGASPNIFRTVGTNTVDGSVAAVEWCLMSQAATGGGTMWSRVVFSTINLASGDSLQTTYDLTVE